MSDPNSSAAKERQSAADHYKQNPPPTTNYDFTAYKADDIREALAQLFHHKCAFCESRYRSTAQMEVEHYRPKGRVRGGDRLGYWWLALEWSNLLPSCIDCNRTRRHRIATLAADGTVTYAEVVAGKLDQFPIAGAHRATSAEDDLSLEAALLIDPTREDPDAHLRWIVEHLHLPIAAAALVGRQEDPRGRSSIDVLALNREGLIEERAALLQEIALDVARIRKVLVTSLAVPEESRADVLKLAVDQLAELNRHAHPERPFSSIATAFIRQEKQKLRDEFSALLADEF